MRVVKVRWSGGDTLQLGGTQQGHVRSYSGDDVPDRDMHEDVGMVIETVMASPDVWVWATTKVGRKLAPGNKVAVVDGKMEWPPVVVVIPDGWAHG